MSEGTERRPPGNPNWVRGCPSPNPAGRPRTGLALSEAIRARLDPDTLNELITVALDVALGRPLSRDVEWVRENAARRRRNEPPLPPPANGMVEQPSIAEQMKAMEWLATWARFEKAPTQLEVSPGPQYDAAALSTEELRALAAARAKMLAAG